MNSSIKIEREDRVAILTISRPEALNAINTDVMLQLADIMEGYDTDNKIGCILLKGSEKAFSAGADINESIQREYPDVFSENWLAGWERISKIRLPLVASVRGYALGGGCELAMSCDMIIAGEDAKFGQPEIKLGVIPGMGGTQRLTRAIGKAKAADLLLTGRFMDAQEAERAGLISRIVATEDTDKIALEAAQTIASYGRVAAMMIKETLGRSFETSLSEGLLFERRAFHACFATEDRVEGMRAFAEKRTAQFNKESLKK